MFLPFDLHIIVLRGFYRALNGINGLVCFLLKGYIYDCLMKINGVHPSVKSSGCLSHLPNVFWFHSFECIIKGMLALRWLII